MIFDRPSPRWFTLAAHRPFLDDLARTLVTTLGDTPEALADAIVLLPTRRTARALADAFVVAAPGRALLLPQIRALGDLEEGEPPFEAGELEIDLPPAITPDRRRFELARLAADHANLFEDPFDARSALEIGDALGAFLDALQIEEVSAEGRLAELAPLELAAHWKKAEAVLALAVDEWPKRLAALGLMDVNARRAALLNALAGQWELRPPERPLIVAGSTGSAPAAAAVLRAASRAPMGCVVLPGLDTDLDPAAWCKIARDEAHPQAAMKRLLDGAGIDRVAVVQWPSAAVEAMRHRSRRRVVNEALRPADATDDWLEVISTLKQEGDDAGVNPVAGGLAGLFRASARTEEEAAAVCAVLLRETLSEPGKTATLVTPDMALARRVSARLSRWGIEADSSAGRPLSGFPAGVLLTLVARGAARLARPEPAVLLGLLKQPLTHLGQFRDDHERATATLERRALRGARPKSFAAIHKRIATYAEGMAANPELTDEAKEQTLKPLPAAHDLAIRLEAALALAAAPFSGGEATAPAAAAALAQAAEALAQGRGPTAGQLWARTDGEAASALIATLMDEAHALPPLTARGFADLMEKLITERPVRTAGAPHPRLKILGAIEARLISADRLVLAGLEEGVWPRVPETDPFLSRPMRKVLGLAPPERRIGLSAHDFAQGACAPEVVLVSTGRRGGQPAVKSRWLWRLETLAKGAGMALPERRDTVQWARALDAPLAAPPPALLSARRPRPTPPVEARPRRLSVTRVETWVRDPYAVYAREILGLRVLDRPDAPAEASARGSAIHKAFERFAPEVLHTLETERASLFHRFIIEELERADFPEAAMAREQALAARLGDWAAAFEVERRSDGAIDLLIEQMGSHTFDAPGGPFTLTAKADRIERIGNQAKVLDFKTGEPPSDKQVASGLSPQLTLTAAILARGGFQERAMEPAELAYVRVTGRRVPGEVRRFAPPKDHELQTLIAFADKALAGLVGRVAVFDRVETPYLSWVTPRFMMERGGDYDHLARLYEWFVVGEGEASDAGNGGEAA